MVTSETQNDQTCPKCGSPLGETQTTPTGKQFIRCSAGSWNPQTKETEGCDYIQWMQPEPVALEEACPKCGSPLVLAVTKYGKKLKRCSTNVWDPKTKSSTGCDYVEWLTGTTEQLDEDCPECGAKLVLYTTSSGKRMKKCSTSSWDKKTKQAMGCRYVEWLK